MSEGTIVVIPRPARKRTVAPIRVGYPRKMTQTSLTRDRTAPVAGGRFGEAEKTASSLEAKPRPPPDASTDRRNADPRRRSEPGEGRFPRRRSTLPPPPTLEAPVQPSASGQRWQNVPRHALIRGSGVVFQSAPIAPQNEYTQALTCSEVIGAIRGNSGTTRGTRCVMS